MMSALQAEPAADVARSDNATDDKSSPGQITLLGLAFGVLWFVLCRALSSEWSINEQYTYGWFVPFFAAYLFWLRWQDRPKKFESRNAECETRRWEKSAQREAGSTELGVGRSKKFESRKSKVEI